MGICKKISLVVILKIILCLSPMIPIKRILIKKNCVLRGTNHPRRMFNEFSYAFFIFITNTHNYTLQRLQFPQGSITNKQLP